MGGSCWLIQANGTRVKGPEATSNFAVVPSGFHFRGALVYSVEQAFQAAKFPAGSPAFLRVASIAPLQDDPDSSQHGMACWQAGQERAALVPDWARVKVGVMLEACRAKVAAVAAVREALLATGACQIEGGPSTGWSFQGREHGWQQWNGRIQMLLREELREEAQRTPGLLASLQALFAEYESG